ncbi:MAG: SPOR domain-containing protein [Bacteroidia bacterium]|nr:SPOR domain-containing protein [Bacteroidia bacterium]
MLHFNQITHLIAELLFKHDCVILPEFGGFVTRNFSSNFSKGKTILYPPSKHVIFNKNLVHNDGLLISALMQKNNILIEDATKQIEDYKNYIQSLLSVKKRFELINIGLFYIDTEGFLRFEAKTDVNFLLDSFGFEPVIANEIDIEPIKQIVVKQFEDRKINIETVKEQKTSYAKIATLAVGLPITLAFLFFAAYSKPMKPILESSINPFYTPEKTYTPAAKKIKKAIFIEDIKKTELLADANGYATFKLSENGNVLVASINDSISMADKTAIVKPLNTEKKHNLAFNKKYQIVVGCFGIEENAHNLIKNLASKNINAGISGINNKGLHVVSCASFDSKEEANASLISIKNDLPSAWIMAK